LAIDECRVRIAILRYSVPEPSEICMSEEQLQRFFGFIMGDDLDFYEEYTINLVKEEQERFFRDNQDFMSGFEMECDRMVRKKIYKGILRKIRELEERRNGK